MTFMSSITRQGAVIAALSTLVALAGIVGPISSAVAGPPPDPEYCVTHPC